MKRLALAAAALVVAAFALGWCSAPSYAAPAVLAEPCAASACRVTGAAMKVTVPLQGPVKPKVMVAPILTPAPGHFLGKLVVTVECQHGCGDEPGSVPTKMEDCGGRTCWAIVRPFSYRTHAGDLITVPDGMSTDLASVPRFAWSIIPPDGLWVRAAVVHDFLYKTKGGCVLWKNRPSTCSRAKPYDRAEADAIIDQAMADIGVGMAARVTIWSGVRLGGHGGWGH